MAEEPTENLQKKPVSTANIASIKTTKASLTASARQSQYLVRLGHLLTVTGAIVAGLLTNSSHSFAKLLESQAITTFWQMRGSLVPPEDIVILAIDEQSISVPEQYYKTDPHKYAYLKPLSQFPFQRSAYAEVIDKLMHAGAKAVALDVVFDLPGRYGAEDDRRLQAILKKYGSKIALAAQYEFSVSHQGTFTQLRLPYERFRNTGVSIGTVNFPIEVDGKVHRLASEFVKELPNRDLFIDKLPSFSESVLAAAELKYPQPQGDRIHFWGPARTFEQIPFWYVFDPQNWRNFLQARKAFANKIVIIGATAELAKDFYPVAMSANLSSATAMSGVEIHANAIATMMQGKAIAEAIKIPFMQGLFVFALVGGASLMMLTTKSGIKRFCLGMLLALGWGICSYNTFVFAQLIFPTAIPMLAIAFCGISYLSTEIAREKLRTRQIVHIFQKYKTSPVVQEIISQQQELQDLLQQRDLEVAGKILGGRYTILRVLGSGGFSETYIAEDTQRPGNPRCVVKQLKPANTQAKSLEVARRLFASEAQTLEKLGSHPQIPQLLAYFEQDEEFYLVQEFIIGRPLHRELRSDQRIVESEAIAIVRELLQILVFVHEKYVIHRDIKPSNIIRRESDRKLVLIDFGAVKEISLIPTEKNNQVPFTIGIGTQGYAPSEQCFGRPQYNSDIYAVGMIGIKALTGMAPHELPRDSAGEVQWRDKALVSDRFAQILSKMVREDFKQRHQSATEVLSAIDKLINSQDNQPLPPDENHASIDTYVSADESDSPTAEWL